MILLDDFLKCESLYATIQNFTIEIIFKELQSFSIDKCNCTLSYNNMRFKIQLNFSCQLFQNNCEVLICRTHALVTQNPAGHSQDPSMENRQKYFPRKFLDSCLELQSQGTPTQLTDSSPSLTGMMFTCILDLCIYSMRSSICAWTSHV